MTTTIEELIRNAADARRAAQNALRVAVREACAADWSWDRISAALGVSPDGERQTSPETYLSRTDAQRALWAMTVDGRAEYILVDRLGLLRQLGMAPTPGQPPT